MNSLEIIGNALQILEIDIELLDKANFILRYLVRIIVFPMEEGTKKKLKIKE